MKRFLRQLHYGQRAFTLIELLIVVAILGILAAVIVPNLAGFLTTGNVAAANTEVANVESAALAYYADHDGTWPTNSGDLVSDYISNTPKYAVYEFDPYGKVTNVSATTAASSAGITWVAADHEWKKASGGGG